MVVMPFIYWKSTYTWNIKHIWVQTVCNVRKIKAACDSSYPERPHIFTRKLRCTRWIQYMTIILKELKCPRKKVGRESQEGALTNLERARRTSWSTQDLNWTLKNGKGTEVERKASDQKRQTHKDAGWWLRQEGVPWTCPVMAHLIMTSVSHTSPSSQLASFLPLCPA